jgi:hypothetical protein
MSLLLRIMLPLIGYVCTATVISAALGYGYLRRAGTLNDAAAYRIVALLHGIDPEAVDKSLKEITTGTPPEEPSFDDRQQRYRAAALQFDAKQKQLSDSLTDFDYQLKRLNDETTKYSQLKTDVEQYLKQQVDDITAGQKKKVREQLEAMHPRKQAKPILISMVTEGRTDEVIQLLGSMKTQNQKEIIKTFDTPEDIEMLSRIQRKMLAGEPTLPYINDRLKELEQLKEQEK